MDKIHDHHDDDYDRVHRETFEAWRRANLEEVSLSTLRTMERRLRKTLGEMHEQVHQCREEMGLPARNWPVFQ